MRTNGNAALSQKSNRIRHDLTPFDLDHMRPCSHNFGSILKRLFWRNLVAAKRHVSDDEGVIAAAFDGGGVISNVAHRDWQGGVMALNHVAQRIADQHGFDAGAIEIFSPAR